MAPKEVSKTHKYVVLHGKRNSADVVKVMGFITGSVSQIIWVSPI